MTKRKINPYKAHGNETKVRQYVKLDDLPDLIREKYNGFKLSQQVVDWAIRVAAGEDAMSVTREVYTLGDNKAEIKRTSNELLRNPKVVEMVNVLRDNFKHQAIVNTNGILSRLEMLYSEAIYDGDKRLALDVLKQMSNIITNLDGSVSVSDITIQFTLPNTINAKTIDITEAEINE
jgi:hypothetical protein